MGLRGPGARPKQPTGKPKRQPWEVRGLTRAERVKRFLESLRVTCGTLSGQKFKLRPWQLEIVNAWYATADGRRIVRTGLLSVARKNGKTGLLAALALCHLLGPEQEPRGQIVVGATDRDQSGLVFDEVVAYINDNAFFSATCNIQRHSKIIEHLPSGSKFRALSSDAKKAHGLSPSVVILDELAQWGVGPGRHLYDALTTAQGARRDPLVLIIGTQSADDLSLMSQLVDYCKNVNAGTIDDPTFSGFVFEIPADADVFDEKNWPLANPALDDFRDLQDMRMLAERAGHMPTLEATFRNLFCNQRIDAEERWIGRESWESCNAEAELAGPCFGALDLGSVRDLTAFALFWPDSGALLVWAWCPADALREREEHDRVPYSVWAQRGFIEPTPGRATDKRRVALRLAELCAQYQPEAIAFDLWGITELERVISEEGLTFPPFIPYGQGFKSMSPRNQSL